MNNLAFNIAQVNWQDMKHHLRHIRTEVFLKEQQVPEALEWDEYDQNCLHLLVDINGEYIATARLLSTGQIGRMAVLKAYRQQGIGSKMLNTLLDIARTMDITSVFLNAQVDAVNFYKKFGFLEQGEIFNDANIPHRRMHKTIISK